VKNIITKLQGRYATQIACSMAAANGFQDGDERMTPKALAVRACDIAQQLTQEIERRGWYLESGEHPSGIPMEE
jgi:hypothetical protein